MRVDSGAGVVWVGMTVRALAVVSDLGWVGFQRKSHAHTAVSPRSVDGAVDSLKCKGSPYSITERIGFRSCSW